MKSPFTGGETQLMRESREMIFRKEKFGYIAHYYECLDTYEQFTTRELDELNLIQVYNQYRVKYGIPFPDEISAIRNAYGLSALKMSEILGLGANQYRLYENGEMPSETIGKILKSVRNPITFADYVRNAEHQFCRTDYDKILSKAELAVDRGMRTDDCGQLFKGASRSLQNGYAVQSYGRLKNIILFFVEKCGGVFNTKMNKLLFYADFLSYKLRGVGMTGLAYKAIQYGPVPLQWNVVYGSIEDLDTDIIAFPSGYTGVKLCSELSPDMDAFTDMDIDILSRVFNRFRDMTSNDISEISHNEQAWIDYNGTGRLIDYSEAFYLRAL